MEKNCDDYNYQGLAYVSRDAPEFFFKAVSEAMVCVEAGYDRVDARTFLKLLIRDILFSSLGDSIKKISSDIHVKFGELSEEIGNDLFFFERICLNFDSLNGYHMFLRDKISQTLDEIAFNHPLKISHDFKSFADLEPKDLEQAAFDCMIVLRVLRYITLAFCFEGRLGPSINVRLIGWTQKLEVFDEAPVSFCKYCHRPCDSSNITCDKHRTKHQASYKARIRKLQEKKRILAQLKKSEFAMYLLQYISSENQNLLRQTLDSHMPGLSKVAKTISANNMQDFLSQLFTKIDALAFFENEREQNMGDNTYLVESLLIYEAWEQAFAKSKGRGRPVKFHREDVIRLRNQGYKMTEIAAKLGVSPAAVSKKIRQ